MSLSRILLVEDDQRLAELTADYLGQNGFNVEIEGEGDKAIEHFRAFQPELVILDLSLPGMDGLAVCRALRNEFNGPILMLTARDTSLDQVVGLESGADDYVTKPVEPMVLLARTRALLRRTSPAETQCQGLQVGELKLQFDSREVTLAGEPVQLTSLEFDLLTILMTHVGKIVTRDQLHQEARGIDYDGLDRTVDVRISKLRRKLGDTSEPPAAIKTIWGKGYLLSAESWARES